MDPFEDEEEGMEDEEDNSVSIDSFYRAIAVAMEPFRLEMILDGGDIRLAGVSTDGRVFVRIKGRAASLCQQKREVLQKLEGVLQKTVPQVRQVISICPSTPLDEAQ